LFDDNNAHNLDSATSTLTEQAPDSAEGLIPGAQASDPSQHSVRQPSGDRRAQDRDGHRSEPSQEETQPSGGNEDFASALENFTTESAEAASEDNVIRGTVLKVTASHVVVDIGAKSEGMLPIAEVLDHEGNPKFKPGDEIDVMRDKGEAEEGYINLSHQKAARLRAWDEIEKAYNEKRPSRPWW